MPEESFTEGAQMDSRRTSFHLALERLHNTGCNLTREKFSVIVVNGQVSNTTRVFTSKLILNIVCMKNI